MGTVSSKTSGPVTVCVTQQVKPGLELDFESWLQGISKAAEQFPGHLGINVIRPSINSRNYTYIFRFDSYSHLQQWETSDERERWVNKLHGLTETPSKKQILTGLEYWFTLPGDPTKLPPPRYKMTLVTILAIYPLTTLLGFLVSPAPLTATRLLNGLVVSIIAVTCMTYLIMPRVTRLFARWLFGK